MVNNKIFIFTGPSGVERHSIEEMIRITHDFNSVIPYTTRQPRVGEVDGQTAHFIRPAKFLQALQKSEFLEMTEINGDLYGIKYQDIEEKRTEGNICLVLSSTGAEKLKAIYKDNVIRIFIYADTTMREDEMKYKEYCEFHVENRDLAHTVYALARNLNPLLDRNLIELD